MARPVQMLEISVVSDHVIGTGEESAIDGGDNCSRARPLEKRDVLMHVGST